MTLEVINNLQCKLQNFLGKQYPVYLENMRDWFGLKVTKEFFDERMGSLLKDGGVELHNELMKQILFQCNGIPAPAPELSLSLASSFTEPEKKEHFVEFEPNPNDEYHQEEQECITINFVNSEEDCGNEDPLEIKAPVVTTVDWLYNVEVQKFGDVEINSSMLPKRITRIPPDYRPCREESKHVPNITQGYDINQRIARIPQLGQHFRHVSSGSSNPDPHQPYLPAGATVHGKFMAKSWEYGMDGVDIDCTKILMIAVKQHIKSIVTEIIKQRRSFLMRDDKVFHSIGTPYPNPYLRQGHHLYDVPYSSDSTTLADVMQVPKMLPTADELARIATLQIASSTPIKEWRFPANRGTLADLLNVIENNPSIIPIAKSRLKMLVAIAKNYKGFAGNFHTESEDDSDNSESASNMLPIISY